MRRFVPVILLITILGGTLPVAAGERFEVSENQKLASAPASKRAVPGEVIVSYGSAVPLARQKQVAASVGHPAARTGRSHLVDVPQGTSVTEAIAELESTAGVLYAEPNYLYTSDALAPNDPGYPDQWGLHSSPGTSASDAWDVTTGSSSVVVAVVDSGVDASHADLSPNTWVNAGETATNGIDDDGNGYVDDVRGWDWASDDNDPADGHGHGTHVAGIATARGNDGQGVAGVSWNSRVMALRALDAEGIGSTFDIARAFNYAARHGVKIVNASLGGDSYSRTLADSISSAPGTLFVVSSGNGGTDGVGDDNSTTSSYPCNLTSDNVICVAASDTSGELASFSNYGSTSVDLAAPGTSIVSTVPGGWAYASGTSMSAPFVSGAAALLWSVRPNASVAMIKDALIKGVDSAPDMDGKLVSGGRLNILSSIAALGTGVIQPEPKPSPTPEDDSETLPDSGPVPLPGPSIDPLPGSEPTSEPSPEPSESPTPEPDPSPTPEPEPPLPEVEPDPEPEPEPTILLEVEKGTKRIKVRGAVTDAAEDQVTVVLHKRKEGRFKRIARRLPSLGQGSDDLSSFFANFLRPARGRCRIVVTTRAADGSLIEESRTFRC